MAKKQTNEKETDHIMQVSQSLCVSTVLSFRRVASRYAKLMEPCQSICHLSAYKTRFLISLNAVSGKTMKNVLRTLAIFRATASLNMPLRSLMFSFK